MSPVQRVFQVDGKPFFSLGGQARNSSGYNDAESETAFRALKQLHGNTLEIPVYWEQVEPQEGQFDWTPVDALLASARRYGAKLVLLWFGTWKNGNMEYTPAWVKTDPQRFQRVVTPNGVGIWVLSSHCSATFEADRRAFSALCAHLHDHDTERTVIALQIENEPGTLGSDRDYSPLGQAAFESPVPQALVSAMQAAGQGRVYDLWQAAGGKTAGTWPEVFGPAGGELMTAWSIATYIDRLAEAGKAIHNIPMYINVWLGEGSWRLPGGTYPSGGAVARVLDVYKWGAPHIDLIAPDIYIMDSRGYEAMCAAYARPDNPLFVPESAPGRSNTWLMFRAIGDYDAIGYHFFAIEHMLDPQGEVRPEMQSLVGSFRCVAAAIPLLLAYQGTGRVYAAVQEENQGEQYLDLDGYTGIVQFGEGSPIYVGKDWRHPNMARFAPSAMPEERGRGLVFQVGRHEFYVVGANMRLHLRPRVAPELSLDSAWAHGEMAHYVAVDEGHFDADGQFVADRRRNGDETSRGIWVEPDVGVVHVVLCP